MDSWQIHSGGKPSYKDFTRMEAGLLSYFIIDGSNIAHLGNQCGPSLTVLEAVQRELCEQYPECRITIPECRITIFVDSNLPSIFQSQTLSKFHSLTVLTLVYVSFFLFFPLTFRLSLLHTFFLNKYSDPPPFGSLGDPDQDTELPLGLPCPPACHFQLFAFQSM